MTLVVEDGDVNATYLLVGVPNPLAPQASEAGNLSSSDVLGQNPTQCRCARGNIIANIRGVSPLLSSAELSSADCGREKKGLRLRLIPFLVENPTC